MNRRKSLQLRSNGTKSSQGHHRMRNRAFGQTPDKFLMNTGTRGSTRGESMDAHGNMYYMNTDGKGNRSRDSRMPQTADRKFRVKRPLELAQMKQASMPGNQMYN